MINAKFVFTITVCQHSYLLFFFFQYLWGKQGILGWDIHSSPGVGIADGAVWREVKKIFSREEMISGVLQGTGPLQLQAGEQAEMAWFTG